MQLTDDNKYGIFKALMTSTFEQVGYEFGFDKHYKSIAGMKNAVHRVFMEVKTDPKKFAADEQVYDMVLKAVEDRGTNKRSRELKESIAAKAELAKDDFKAVLTDTKNVALSALNAKLQGITSSKKRLDQIPLGTLAQAFGIVFDKSRVLDGDSTENIAVLAKVEENLSSKELLDLVIKQREHATK